MRRREFLKTLLAAPAVVSACDGESGGGTIADAGTIADGGVADGGVDPPDCDPAFAGGTLEGRAEFVGEENPMLDVPFNEGLDGRLYTDLSNLTPETSIIPNDRFYIRTRYPDQLDASGNDPWRIHIGGHVDAPFDLPLDDLLPDVEPMGVHLLECSGNALGARFGLLSAAEWAGVPIAKVFERVRMTSSATRVLIAGFDGHSRPSQRSVAGASWVFTFDDLREAFLATEMNGEPLPPDHGAPVRLFVPGWYGCTNVKWLDTITFVDDSEPATSQMTEFASRTHQNGMPALARDYQPARIETTAMPVRVEKWRVGGRVKYRIVGIMWGGTMPTDKLVIRTGPQADFEPVSFCEPPKTHQTWTLWTHLFQPTQPGQYPIELNLSDPNIPKRRLDSKYYLRTVEISEV